jgi:hypothetical protein
MRQRLAILVALCLSLVVLTSGCSMGSLPAAPTTEPAPTATAVATSSPQPTDTAHSRPTNTARPSATRAKSPTPLPTAPPTEAPTEAPPPDTATAVGALPTDTIDATEQPTRPSLRPTVTFRPRLGSPTPESSDFDFLDQTDYVNSSGDAVVVGLIRYKGTTTISNIEIAVDLEDADHKLLATESADIVPSLVQPGGLIPFSATFTNPPQDYQYYNTTVQGDDADQATIDQYTSDFQASDTNLVAGSDPSTPTLVGKVTNTGDVTAQDPLVIAAILDKDGNILDVSSAYTTLSNLSQGQESSFEIQFDNGDGAARSEIVVSADAVR